MEPSETKISVGPKIEFFVTGFRPFLDHGTNPTVTLIEELKKLGEEITAPEKVGSYRLRDLRVLDVSVKACEAYYEEMREQIGSVISSGGIPVVVHLGVNFGGKQIDLELHGYNEATFRGADNEGVKKEKERIAKAFPLEHYFRTQLPIREICQTLDEKHPCCIKLSNDPGRYICNYIYYLSLKEGYSKGFPSLFVHVPPFTILEQERQSGIIADILSNIANHIKSEKAAETTTVVN
eukprot:TRINITY_DN3684_c0_g1_i2.p1 TRINITY_DN3684_c0_g1~~TRINITY_DN3684_c0_g1_i2.p1  ORF type:complete len:237 (-),score=39.90 TRINITY_DN3684_c0_g1_i2:116-826(-)